MNSNAAPIFRPARILALAGLLLALPAGSALAQSADTDLATISDQLLFAVSGGSWEGTEMGGSIAGNGAGSSAEPAAAAENGSADGATEPADTSETAEDATETDAATADDPAAAGEPDESADEQAGAAGYYRLVAIRTGDNTSRVYLQQVALGADGPETIATTEIEEISALPAYVTDVRKEDSPSLTDEPGFSAFVTLKIDPNATEPETWTVFVDEFGEIAVARATN